MISKIPNSNVHLREKKWNYFNIISMYEKKIVYIKAVILSFLYEYFTGIRTYIFKQ